MRNGIPLETVSKWLGHRGTAVTMRRYWTDDVEYLELKIPMLDDGQSEACTVSETTKNLCHELERKCEQVRRLKEKLRAARGTAAASVSTDSDDEDDPDELWEWP